MTPAAPFCPAFYCFQTSPCAGKQRSGRGIYTRPKIPSGNWHGRLKGTGTDRYRYEAAPVRRWRTVTNHQSLSVLVSAPLALPPLFSFSYDSLSAHESHCTICPHPVPPVAFGGQPLQQLEFPMFRPTHDCFYGIFWFSVAHAPPDNRNKNRSSSSSPYQS